MEYGNLPCVLHVRTQNKRQNDLFIYLETIWNIHKIPKKSPIPQFIYNAQPTEILAGTFRSLKNENSKLFVKAQM